MEDAQDDDDDVGEVEEDQEEDDPDENPPWRCHYPTLFVHRRLAEDQFGIYWVRVNGFDVGHEVDSRVHCYDREVGFLREQEDQDMIERNVAARIAFARRRQDPRKRKAHSQTVHRWALFERWVLAEMPLEPYATFLRDCDGLTPNVRFIGPPVALVVTYMDTIRAWPLKANSVKVYLNAISSTCGEFGVKASPCSHDDVSRQMKGWMDIDGEASSIAFDMEADLKILWGVVWTIRGWHPLKTQQYWTMLLVAIAMFARASEMTVYLTYTDNHVIQIDMHVINPTCRTLPSTS